MPARHPRPAPDLFTSISRPLTRTNATPASRQGAERSEPTAAEVARMALAQFVPSGAQWNADEVAGLIGIHWIRVRPRVSQLLHTGLLRVVRENPLDESSPAVQRPSANNNPADLLELTSTGLMMALSGGPLPKPPRPPKAGNDAA